MNTTHTLTRVIAATLLSGGVAMGGFGRLLPPQPARGRPI